MTVKKIMTEKRSQRATDSNTTLQDLKMYKAQFVKERDWTPSHTPKNLSMSIAIEAAELMEKFQFLTNEESFEAVRTNKEEIADELADVLAYMLSFANVCAIDIVEAFMKKMEQNAQKYPSALAKGTHAKYTKLCR